MQYIGFQHNLPRRGNWRGLSPSVLNRVALIDARLRDVDFRLFYYSPADIDPDFPTVPGFEFEAGRFRPVRTAIPMVNGNWTARTRRLLKGGMGYPEFGRWSAAHGLGIYVPHAFSELLGDKLETYKLVRGFHETLHQHCEPYADSLKQLEYFVESGKLTFIKPRSGSKGDGIISIRRRADGLTLTRYHKGKQQRLRAANLAAALEFIAESNRTKYYLIQHGIETMRHHGSTFDVRVTMLHDGATWQWLHEARVSPPDSDVSNLSQGGRTTATEDLLFDLVGIEDSQELLRELRSESFGLASYLEQLHPGEILELAFDFALDREARLRLIEINTKPGLAGLGSDVSIYDKRPEHETMFEQWVYPHTAYLAQFLAAKAVERSAVAN